MELKEWVERWKQQAGKLRVEIYALYLAYQDERVPLYARIFTALVVGYAFSPIDLIPDFIPIIGYLDDMVLIPLGIAMALSMIPAVVMAESRERAREIMGQAKPVNRAAAVLIVLLWILLAAVTASLVIKIDKNK